MRSPLPLCQVSGGDIGITDLHSTLTKAATPHAMIRNAANRFTH